MDKIITQDCYLPVESDKTNFIVTEMDKMDYVGSFVNCTVMFVEKHTDMVVLTKQEFEKAIGNAYDVVFNSPAGHTVPDKATYIASILK